MGYESLQNAVRTRFITEVSTPRSLPVAWENMVFDATAELHARVMVEQTDTQFLYTAGSGNTYRRNGRLVVEIRGKANYGEEPIRDTFDAIITAFRGVTAGGVTYGVPLRLSSDNREGVFWSVTYGITFYSDFTEGRPVGSPPGASVTRELAANTINTRFLNQCQTPLNLDTSYDNLHFDPTTTHWCRFTIRDGNGRQIDSAPTYRTVGVAICQLFAPARIGTAVQIQYIDTISAAFRAVTVSGVRFKTPSVSTIGNGGLILLRTAQERPWWQTNVRLPFEYDEVGV